MAINSTIDKFLQLDYQTKKKIHLDLCIKSLNIWNKYIKKVGTIKYTEIVCGTKQIIDPKLPTDAYNCIIKKELPIKIKKRYREPICALQDDDVEFPEKIEYAYYSIYNLFIKYCYSENIDDWLIVNQALSANYSNDSINQLKKIVDLKYEEQLKNNS